ncbi:hypothetical protein ATC00_20880 [Sinorhizobium americanum]|nr:hypothetical protein ATC00_20880 [Sinorhizobium americanum]
MSRSDRSGSAIDAGDQSHWMMFRGPTRGSAEQFRVCELLAHHPMNRPAQALDRPVVTSTIENAHDIAPAVPRPQLSDRRQPCLRRCNQVIEVGALARCGNRTDRLRSPFPQPGIAGKPAARLAACIPDLVRSAISARSSWDLGHGLVQ